MVRIGGGERVKISSGRSGEPQPWDEMQRGWDRWWMGLGLLAYSVERGGHRADKWAWGCAWEVEE
jgi:hypothetical protein